MGVQIPLRFPVFISYGYIPKSETYCSYDSCIKKKIKKPPYYFLQWLHWFTSTSSAQTFPFLHILPNTYFFLSDNNHSNRYKVISHYGFDVHFPVDCLCWTPLHVSNGLVMLVLVLVLIGIQSLPIFKLDYVFAIELYDFVVFFGY